jgi:oxaloacetate decarboxylase beta subunit
MALPFLLGNIIMIAVAFALIYLAVKKQYEPLLLIPIGFGALLVNLPGSELMNPGGLLRIIYDFGVRTDLFPILVFMGIGAMCDFGAFLERPWVIVFSIPATFAGIFVPILLSLLLGFQPLEATSIGIIGAMDGPTAIYVSSKYAPNLLGPITVAAYTYIATVPILQTRVSKILTSKRERLARMPYSPKAYSQNVRLIFPIAAAVVIGLMAPQGIPLVGALMLGNFLRESKVVERLSKTAQNEITNISTLLLGVAIGGTMEAERFLNFQTLLVFGLGLVAFVSGLTSGIMFGKLAYILTKGKVNPLIGACGSSAFPMGARTAHRIGREEDPDNWLLVHAIAANSIGQVVSVIAGGAILTFVPMLLSLR